MKQDISRRDFFKLFGLNNSRSALLDGAKTVPVFPNIRKDNLPTFAMGAFKLTKTKESSSICDFCEADCGLIVSVNESGEVINVQKDPDSQHSNDSQGYPENCPLKILEENSSEKDNN